MDIGRSGRRYPDKIAMGQSIGNKRIVFFETREFEKLNFHVDKSIGEPLIKSIAVGRIDEKLRSMML